MCSGFFESCLSLCLTQSLPRMFEKSFRPWPRLFIELKSDGSIDNKRVVTSYVKVVDVAEFLFQTTYG